MWSDGASNGVLLQGQGVKVGIIDTGAQANNAALSGRITWYQNYAGTDLTTQDVAGHGTLVTEDLGGTATGNFRGGVAPQAELYVARAISDTGGGSEAYFVNAINDLVAQNVRLFNISAGNSTSITQAMAGDWNTNGLNWEISSYQTVLNHDALVVVAAGNNGQADVSQLAGLPLASAQYAHNWLAVVNVTLDADGHVSGLDKSTDVPSSACGAAASFCLVAPGLFYGVGAANTGFSSGGAEGTSMSAPVVTGVAALVWQKFPWMSASNVQETLLGTATSLGDPSLYGYGLVNADKAIRGPGKFDWGVFQANIPNGATATFSNDITGTGSLTVGAGGLGTLVLSGANTYSGGSTVNSGVLQIDGSVASPVTVNAQGVLAGKGVVNGNVAVNNNGNISTYFGPLTINGNYTAAAYANHVILIGTPLQVNGTAVLNGSSLTVGEPSGYTVKSVEPLLVAAGGLTGTFGSVGYSGSVYLSGTLSYTSTTANIALTGVSPSAVAIAAAPLSAVSTQRTAQNLDKALAQVDTWVTTGAPGHGDFIAAAGDFQHAPTLAVAAASINSLSGEIHASSQALNLQQANIVSRTVADRLADPSFAQGGAWVQATGANGDLSRPGFSTGNYTGGGAMAGIDAALGEGSIIGAALSWNRLTADYDGDTGRSTSRATGFSLYGRYGLGNAYLAGRLGKDWVRSTVDRTGMLGQAQQNIGTSRNDGITSAYAETGYVFKSNNWAVTPFGSLGMNHLDRDGFTESGAGGFGLTSGGQSFNETVGQLGSRLSYGWATARGTTFISGFALWQHLFSGRDLSFSAAYVGAPAATFTVQGINPAKDSGWLGAGLTSQIGQHWSWWLNLDAQFTGNSGTSRAATLGAKFNF
ncbi:autotransporter domain-containing protein [Dyella telluris]|uniref:Autotransporter domain-containing protein n=1 Tax=Dyella telluris TaxID=2763498 RepID=A0A7G8Q606_9GAMM|nr:autotransporter domain-containing protein [Dyella telluris]QNK02214.1 autotransporter domain-containing protein [Dyella telluris]